MGGIPTEWVEMGLVGGRTGLTGDDATLQQDNSDDNSL